MPRQHAGRLEAGDLVVADARTHQLLTGEEALSVPNLHLRGGERSVDLCVGNRRPVVPLQVVGASQRRLVLPPRQRGDDARRRSQLTGAAWRCANHARMAATSLA